MLKQDDLIKGQLVLTGYRFGQAYGSGHIPAQMVMSAIGNRVRAGWGGWLQVLEGIPNFMAEKELPPLVYPATLWDGAFVKLLHAVDSVFEGSAQDLSKGALYFCDTNKVERAWFKNRVLGEREQHPVTANMNSLMFFK